jgi:DNA modification methylase
MTVVTERLDLAGSVGPAELRTTPICRWFVFPHSYSITLVDSILKRINAGPENEVFDPCIGAGTTLVACRSRNIRAFGSDIMPLSVVVSLAKIQSYHLKDLITAFLKIVEEMGCNNPQSVHTDIRLLNKAFPQSVLARAHQIKSIIWHCCSPRLRTFFLTAILKCFSDFGSFKKDGGWPRLTDRAKMPGNQFDTAFLSTVAEMIDDVTDNPEYFDKKPKTWTVHKADMRAFSSRHRVDFIVTSPPYLNKHDYTRIFTPELSLAGILTNQELIELRYHMMRSHVEAKRPAKITRMPDIAEVNDNLDLIVKNIKDNRVMPMIKGYLEDTYAFLARCYAKLRPDGYICLVLSNVQFEGAQVELDNIVEAMSRDLGLIPKEKWVLRYRGNSSQQMAEYGRNPSREFVLFLRKPK